MPNGGSVGSAVGLVVRGRIAVAASITNDAERDREHRDDREHWVRRWAAGSPSLFLAAPTRSVATNVVSGTAATMPRLPASVRTISVAISSLFQISAVGWLLISRTTSSGSEAPT